jgi:hypothetical protein
VPVTFDTVLKAFYVKVFLEWIVKNPLYRLDEERFDKPGFLYKIDEFLFGLPFLCSPVNVKANADVL